MKIKDCCNGQPYETNQYGLVTLICITCRKTVRAIDKKSAIERWNECFAKVDEKEHNKPIDYALWVVGVIITIFLFWLSAQGS